MNKQCALQERENETGREGERGAVERRMGGGGGGGDEGGLKKRREKQLRPHFHTGMPDEAAVIFWRENTPLLFRRRCANAEVADQ